MATAWHEVGSADVRGSVHVEDTPGYRLCFCLERETAGGGADTERERQRERLSSRLLAERGAGGGAGSYDPETMT